MDNITSLYMNVYHVHNGMQYDTFMYYIKDRTFKYVMEIVYIKIRGIIHLFYRYFTEVCCTIKNLTIEEKISREKRKIKTSRIYFDQDSGIENAIDV